MSAIVSVPPSPLQRFSAPAAASAARRISTSYHVGPGGIAITDRRQLTHGAIVPNVVVDLYLPIIGYDGLGVLTLLYRLANRDARVLANLDNFARAGRVGFRRFSQLLRLLEELALLTVQKPSGSARLKHHRTTITLLDPPTTVPAALTPLVRDRTVTPWLLGDHAAGEATEERGRADDTAFRDEPAAGTELSDRRSAGYQPGVPDLSSSSSRECTRQENEPTDNEPIGESPGRAGGAAPWRAAAPLVESPVAQRQLAPASDPRHTATLEDHWTRHAARPRPSDAEQLHTLCAAYGQPWVMAAITSLGKRAPIYKLDAVQVTLARWQREQSWGSPAPRRKRRAGTEPRSTPLDEDDARQNHPVVAGYRAAFGQVPSSEQADAMIAEVHDSAIWAQTLHAWRLNGHRPQNVAGVLDRYARQVFDHSARPRTAKTPPVATASGVDPDPTTSVAAREDLTRTWERVLQIVATQLAGDAVEAWLRPAGLIQIDEAEATIAAGNVFARDMLQTHYQPLLELAFAAELGRRVAVQVVIC